MIESKALERLV